MLKTKHITECELKGTGSFERLVTTESRLYFHVVRSWDGSFWDGFDTCNSNGGHLAEANDEQEFEAIKLTLWKFCLERGITQTKVWIGLWFETFYGLKPQAEWYNSYKAYEYEASVPVYNVPQYNCLAMTIDDANTLQPKYTIEGMDCNTQKNYFMCHQECGSFNPYQECNQIQA